MRNSKLNAFGKQAYPYLLVAPVALIILVGLVYPLIRMVSLSLQYHVIYRPNDIHFAGFSNFVNLLQDKYFWPSLAASIKWVAGSVIPQLLLGFGMALFLNQQFAGRGLVRTILLSPWVLSGVVTGIVWLWIFDGTIGVVNDLLMKLGLIDLPIAWGTRRNTAFMTLFFANTWRGAPFFAITLLAALQGIHPELYEAASIDGASTFQRFRYITFPLVLNTIMVTTLLRCIWTFNWVDLILTMTQGGPMNATRTLAMYIYEAAYIDGDFGYAAALSVALCIILMFLGGMYIGWSRKADD